MKSMSRRIVLLAILLTASVLLSGACSSSDSEVKTGANVVVPTDADPLPPAPRTTASLDVGAVMRQVHFAFRQNDVGEWSGGHSTFAVTAGDSSFEVTPGVVSADAQSDLVGTPVRFTTREVWRTASGSSASTAQRTGAAGVDTDGSLLLPRAGYAERLKNGNEGVEQSFHFDTPMDGAGDLEVLIDVEGAAHVGQTEGGHHFRDSNAEVGLRYGVATWVDAAGLRTPVDVQWNGRALALKVPASVVEGSRYPCVLDPVIAPEVELDEPIYVPAQLDQSVPRVSTDGDGYLVVWRDGRQVDTASYKIMAAGLNASGVLLDPGGLVIADEDVGSQSSPQLVYGSAQYLIAWNGRSTANRTIKYRRVIAAGINLGPAVTVVTSTSDFGRPAVGFDGSGYLLAYSVGTSGISGARVNLQGNIATPNKTLVNVTDIQTAPAVVFNGTHYMLVWQDRRVGPSFDVYGMRIVPGGLMQVDIDGFPISSAANDQLNPEIATDGNDFLVTWSDGKWGAATPDIYGSRVTAAGLVLDPSGVEIAAAPGIQSVPTVDRHGSEYLVTWTDDQSGNEDVLATRVNDAGGILDPGGFSVSAGAANESLSDIVCKTGECLVVWQDDRAGDDDIYASRISQNTIIDPNGILMTTTAHREEKPSIAWGGTDYLVVWQDRRLGGWDIYGARVDQAATMSLDPGGFIIADEAGDQLSPVLSAGGGGYYVAWEDVLNPGDPATIRGRALDGQGAPIGPESAISSPTSETLDPQIAFNGTDHLVVWQQDWPTRILQAAIVAPSGVVQAPFALMPDTGGTRSHPSVASDGDIWFVSYEDDLTTNRLKGVRIAADGTLLGYVNVRNAVVYRPAVAYNGTNFVVAYDSGSYPNFNVHAVRVTPSGTTLDPAGISVSIGPGGQAQPAIACSSGDCIITWRDNRNFSNAEIFGGRFTEAGDVPDGNGFLVSTNGLHWEISMAADGQGHFAVAYAHTHPAVPFGMLRANMRLITSLPLASVCADALECSSGNCVDGVCCNTACGGSALDCQACSVTAGAPADGSCSLLSGTSCDDADVCTEGDTCDFGLCTGTTVFCVPSDACHGAGVCSPMSGCTDPALPNGTGCDDLDLCTQTDTCNAGVCEGSDVVACVSTQCQTSTCDPATGACVLDDVPDGTVCDDGSACTQTDSCAAGVCVGSNETQCPEDACHFAGTCNPATGQCQLPNKPNGTPCDDGDLCSSGDACVAGVCGGVTVECPAQNDCQVAGTCNPANGQCVPTFQPNGTSCDDGSLCTTGDICTAGACAGVAVVCPAQNECELAGTCNPTDGQCVPTFQPDGANCDDGDACTSTDSCTAGVCGGETVTCLAQNDCEQPGSCNPVNGECIPALQPDGTSCDDGSPCTTADSCTSGTCQGVDVQCPATTDECSVGSCNPVSGECDYDAVEDGTACGDGCIVGASCASGTCAGGQPVDCPAIDDCHVVGSCDPDDGTCDSPTAPDGTPCNGSDGNGTCNSGECVATGNGGAGGAGGAGGETSSGGGGAMSSAGGDSSGGGNERPSEGDGDEGCGCRQVGHNGRSSGQVFALLLLGVMAIGRRRSALGRTAA